MEELIESFASSEVTPQVNSTARDHPYFSSLYKAKPSGASQEERRKKFLSAQKQRRFDHTAHARKLATNEWSSNDEEEELYEEESEEMECDQVHIKKPTRSYRNQLMLSEWLVEVPYDLETEWLLVPCPVGKRCLVVASRSQTKVYTKSGYQINRFISSLPGGGKAKGGTVAHSYSLLDCIYNEEEQTYYILDIMCWNSHPCYESDTEFRFYWLQSKIDETPEVKEVTKLNPFKFLPLSYSSCDKESIKTTLDSDFSFQCQLDGLLFYHKRLHYLCGTTTPLVGWLKAFMVPEMLGIEVRNELLKDRPASYVNMRQHVPEAFESHEQRKAAEEKQMITEE